MAQKIVYWLLITLILSLGFGQLLRFDFYGLPLYLHDILVILLLLTSCLQGQALKVKSLGLQGLALLGSGLALSWLYASTQYPLTQLLIPMLYTLRLLAYLALYLTLKKSSFIIHHSLFMIAGAAALIIGFLQYFLLPDMRVFQYLGWDDHLSRLTLPHFDPTFSAVMLSLFALSFTSYRSLYAVSCKLLSSLAILLTYSRSVWLSLVLTGLLFIKNKLLLLFAFSFMLLAIVFLPKKFGEGTNLLRTYSITSRFQSDLYYIKKYRWDLLVGRGMNTLILDTVPAKYGDHATGPNNSYLYLLLTTGVFGLAGWGIFMYRLFQKSTHKPMLIFFFIASLFNNVMFYPFALLWVLLITAQEIT